VFEKLDKNGDVTNPVGDGYFFAT
jgi:hypothetical protein